MYWYRLAIQAEYPMQQRVYAARLSARVSLLSYRPIMSCLSRR